MKKIAPSIAERKVAHNSLSIFWLGQAGFVLKTHEGKIIYVDPYLTDCVERVHGFKRIMASVLEPDEVIADFVICTHQHLDHMDIDAIPVIARNCKTKFIGPPECMEKCRELGIPWERLTVITEGEEKSFDEIRFLAVFADHGELAPEAIGLVLDFQFTRVYLSGDTAYCPEKMSQVVALKPEVIIPVINGRFGNMDPQQAALLTRDVQAKVAVPCHFWMFAEHNGDPGAFIEACRRLAPQAQPVLIGQGGEYTYIQE